VYRSGFAFNGVGLCSSAGVAGAVAILILVLSLGFLLSPAFALTIELDDIAPDRIERQRAFARGDLPGSAAPDLETLKDRLAAQGLAEGAPILIRIFKAESELEVWMRKGGTFVLHESFPICHWTGSLGPKLREGDKQSPEGFYMIGHRQMRHRGRWREAFNLGFPNLHDKRLDRTGSYILVHGGCSSTGCYAMTEPAARVIHRLAAAALRGRQSQFQVHVFPFRMTDANMATHAANPWADFWRDLKAGYDAFEATRLPPRIGVCGQRYTVAQAAPGVRSDGRMTRVNPGTPSAAGFDTIRCGIPVVRPDQQIANVPDPEPESGLGLSDGANPPLRTAARVERQEARRARPSRARRHAASVRSRAFRHRRHAASRPKRHRSREARRIYREALFQSYRRTMVGISQ
jgi:murein L,D-transpeptidase YafK